MLAVSKARLFAVIALTVLFASGCDMAVVEPISPVIRPVKLFEVQSLEKAQLRHFPGKVTATDEAEISFSIAGQINKFTVKQGDEVRVGQVLARLDDRDILNELKDRQASYELLKNEFDRAQSLINKKVISQADYETASAKLTSAKAALRLARDKLEDSTLKAPFNGRIAQTFVENFQHVKAQEPVLVIQSSNMLDISIQMPESIVSHVDKKSVDLGYKPTATFPGAPGKSYPVTYKEHATKVTPGTQSYEVVFSLPVPDDLNVLPGMSATVIVDIAKIVNKHQSVGYVLVPLSAVSRDDASNQTVVWSFNENTSKVKPVDVQVGRISEAGVHIVSGLNPGDRIVMAGISRLSNGMKVKPLRKERGL